MTTTKELATLPFDDLLDHISSEGVAPGGGAIAALVVSMAAGLVEAVARGSDSGWEEAGGAAGEAHALRARVRPLAQENADAYDEALEALRNPERLEPDPQRRDEAIGETLQHAANVPLAIAAIAADVGSLAADVAERGDARLRGDAVVAALLAQAATRSTTHLLEINLAIHDQDARLKRAQELTGRVDAAAGRALATANL